jgi:hypothetical protein
MHAVAPPMFCFYSNQALLGINYASTTYGSSARQRILANTFTHPDNAVHVFLFTLNVQFPLQKAGLNKC